MQLLSAVCGCEALPPVFFPSPRAPPSGCWCTLSACVQAACGPPAPQPAGRCTQPAANTLHPPSLTACLLLPCLHEDKKKTNSHVSMFFVFITTDFQHWPRRFWYFILLKSHQWFSPAEKHPELPVAMMQSSDGLLHPLKQRSPGPAGPLPAPQSKNAGSQDREKSVSNNNIQKTHWCN